MNNTNKSPNQMTKLLNKIERRLGLQVITLPEKINKDSWHTVIEEDTIPEFSRYFPNKIISIIDWLDLPKMSENVISSLQLPTVRALV